MDEAIGTGLPSGRPENGAEQFVRARPSAPLSAAAALLDYVRENPGKTVLVSAAIGVVLGRLLRRL